MTEHTSKMVVATLIRIESKESSCPLDLSISEGRWVLCTAPMVGIDDSATFNQLEIIYSEGVWVLRDSVEDLSCELGTDDLTDLKGIMTKLM